MRLVWQEKPATFKVTVKAIKAKELPELDDEFASEVSDFETLDEYKADLKAKALERKEKEAKTAKQNALVDKAVENASMEIADAMITSQARNMANDFAQRLQMQGMTVDQYLQYTGLTREALVDQMKPQAETLVLRIVLFLRQLLRLRTSKFLTKRLRLRCRRWQTHTRWNLTRLRSILVRLARICLKDDLGCTEEGSCTNMIVDSAK